MIIRKSALAAVTIAVLSPVIANATPQKASVQACARAFATSLAAPGASAPAYKLAYRGGVASSLSDYYPTAYTFTLEAHNPKTGAAFARALCSTNSRGAVTAISAVPLDVEPATWALGF
jgi:hypothetical protein